MLRTAQTHLLITQEVEEADHESAEVASLKSALLALQQEVKATKVVFACVFTQCT